MHAADLVCFMRERYGKSICIGVAGDLTYRSSRSRTKAPVLEEESSNDTSELEASEGAVSEVEDGPPKQSIDEYMTFLVAKVKAGADFILTQCVNDVESYTGFLASCREKDVTIPIIPGLLPITNYALFEKVMVMH